MTKLSYEEEEILKHKEADELTLTEYKALLSSRKNHWFEFLDDSELINYDFWNVLLISNFLWEEDPEESKTPIEYFYSSKQNIAALVRLVLDLRVPEDEESYFIETVHLMMIKSILVECQQFSGSSNIYNDALQHFEKAHGLRKIPFPHLFLSCMVDTIWLKEEESATSIRRWPVKLESILSRVDDSIRVTANTERALGDSWRLFAKFMQERGGSYSQDTMIDNDLGPLRDVGIVQAQETTSFDTLNLPYRWKTFQLPTVFSQCNIGYSKKLAFPSWRDQKKVGEILCSRLENDDALTDPLQRRVIKEALRSYVDTSSPPSPHEFSSLPMVFRNEESQQLDEMELIWPLVKRAAQEIDYEVPESEDYDFLLLAERTRTGAYKLFIVTQEQRNFFLSPEIEIQAKGNATKNYFLCSLRNREDSKRNYEECTIRFLKEGFFSSLYAQWKHQEIWFEPIPSPRKIYLAHRPPYEASVGLLLSKKDKSDDAKAEFAGWSLLENQTLPSSPSTSRMSSLNINGLRYFRYLLGYPWLKPRWTFRGSTEGTLSLCGEKQSINLQCIQSDDEECESLWSLPDNCQLLENCYQVIVSNQEDPLTTVYFISSEVTQCKDYPPPDETKYIRRPDDDTFHLGNKDEYHIETSNTPSFWSPSFGRKTIGGDFCVPVWIPEERTRAYNGLTFPERQSLYQRFNEQDISTLKPLPSDKNQRSLRNELEVALMVFLQGKTDGVRAWGPDTRHGRIDNLFSLFSRALRSLHPMENPRYAWRAFVFAMLNAWEEAGYFELRQPSSRYVGVQYKQSRRAGVPLTCFGRQPELWVYPTSTQGYLGVLTGTVTEFERHQLMGEAEKQKLIVRCQTDTAYLLPPRLHIYSNTVQELLDLGFPVKRLKPPSWGLSTALQKWITPWAEERYIEAEDEQIYWWHWQYGRFTPSCNNGDIQVGWIQQDGRAPMYKLDIKRSFLEAFYPSIIKSLERISPEKSQKDTIIAYTRSRREALFAGHLLRHKVLRLSRDTPGNGVYLPLPIARYISALSTYTSGIFLSEPLDTIELTRYCYAYAMSTKSKKSILSNLVDDRDEDE
ncbi:MAG: hypothetical protein EP343_10525 [Deltaproteobacteria bacterium]|nr:MAG: hypothetical protein EP343_10525 [Deltaproteobacteria bacterium]